MANGLSVPAVADALGLHKTTVYRWRENSREFRNAATAAELEAIEAHTVEARRIVGGVWERLAERFNDFDDKWDDLSWTNRIKVMEMMLKHFKTPEDKTTYRETKEVKASIQYRQVDAPAQEPIEAEAVPVDEGDGDD